MPANLTRRGFFKAGAAITEGSYIGYSNPKVTALLNEVQATMNPDKEDQVYRELWPILQADLPVTYLYPAVFATR